MMSKSPGIIVFLALMLAGAGGQAEESQSGNIAPQARISASSTDSQYPLAGVNDRRMDTAWSTQDGLTSGQWLQFNWETVHAVCGLVLHATGRWTQTVDVQVELGGSWVSVGHCGTPEEKAPVHGIVAFKPERTKSLRLLFGGGAAYNEVEVYTDPAIMARYLAEYERISVAVAGDLRGRLMGTASRQDGSAAVRDAEVTVAGRTPNGPWKERARTGQHGDFEVAMPFATRGPIEVTVVKGGLRVRQVFDSGDIATRLTPKPADAPGDRLSLSGTWDFSVDPPKGFPLAPNAMKWRPIQVPAHWEMEGFTAESGRAVYRRTFHVPAAWRGKRIKLFAEAVYSRATVWINGKRAGGHEGGFTPFELDISDLARMDGENEIRVAVDARSMASDVDNASRFAYFELAGIWQPIEVFAIPALHLSHLSVTTDFDEAYRDAELSVEADVVNERGTACTSVLRWRLVDPQGHDVPVSIPASQLSLGPWQRNSVRIRIPVPSPQPWNAEQPRLYILSAEIGESRPEANGRASRVEQRFGFREIEIRGRTLAINGRPVKFRGISRLDAHPLMGRALSSEVDRLDMELIKGANFNMVRATIAPPHPASLDASDELGLYVENEGPTCWGRYSADLRYSVMYMGLMCEYLERDRNHPCVVDWSICNESDYERMFSMAHRKMKSLDPTRIYSATWGDDTLDVVTYHHPISLRRIADSLKDGKPAFFDEVLGLFHGYEDLAIFQDMDPGMRDYWIEGMAEIQRALDAGENQIGAVQFCWTDDAFLVPGKGIGYWRRYHPFIRYNDSVYKMPKRGLVGDVVWGTVDGWRRPRPEYWLSKKLYSPVRIEEKPLAVPAPGGPVIVPVENGNQFIDLNQYVCRWELGDEKGEARAQAGPMSRGRLEIGVQRPPRTEEKLNLEFWDERGRLVDAFRLAFAPHDIPAFPNSGQPARIVEQKGYLDGASAVRLLGPGVELAYDRTSGELYRALIDREVVLTLGPKLHVQKSKAPAADYPLGTFAKIGRVFGPEDVPGDSVWKLTGSGFRTEGHQAALKWDGTYGRDFKGGFEIRMDDAGDAEFRYEFAYNGPEMWVREIGLEFELPLAFDTLSWDRNAEYSVYPVDHIGRPEGRAVAHPAAAQTIPPGDRPYGLDDHPWGSNDFRSTKRRVYASSLTNKGGQGVKVFSDGRQHVRATVGTHGIHLKVLDYYGGTAFTYHEGYHYGPGRLVKTGEVLKGIVRLKFLGDRAGGLS